MSKQASKRTQDGKEDVLMVLIMRYRFAKTKEERQELLSRIKEIDPNAFRNSRKTWQRQARQTWNSGGLDTAALRAERIAKRSGRYQNDNNHNSVKQPNWRARREPAELKRENFKE